MSKVEHVLARLAKGRELCGICGKDVTNESDCVHTQDVPSYSSSNLYCSNNDRYTSMRTKPVTQVMRIGMEMFMYPEMLESLPILDVDQIDPALVEFYSKLSALDYAGPVHVVPLELQYHNTADKSWWPQG